jgi:hypothetical protein
MRSGHPTHTSRRPFSLKEDRSACKVVPAASVQPFIEFVARNPNPIFYPVSEFPDVPKVSNRPLNFVFPSKYGHFGILVVTALS